MTYRSLLGSKPDKRCTSSRRNAGSPSTVVREGTTLAVGRDVAVPPEVAAKTLRDTLTWPEWGPTIEAVESDDRYVDAPDRCRVVIEVPIVAAWYVPVCRRALDRFAELVERETETAKWDPGRGSVSSEIGRSRPSGPGPPASGSPMLGRIRRQLS